MQFTILLTGLLLMVLIAGWQMFEHEASRTRPEYFGEGHFEYSGQRPDPAAQLKASAVVAFGAVGIIAVWVVAAIKVIPHTSVRARRTPPATAVPRTSLSAAGYLGGCAYFLCPILQLVFAIAVFLTGVWDVFHYFRAEDNLSYRGTALWWAEEAANQAALIGLLLLPAAVLLAVTCTVAGMRVSRRWSGVGQAIPRPRFASLAIVVGTFMLWGAYALYTAASVQLFPAIEHAPWQRQISVHSRLHADGLRIERLYLASCFPAVAGVWHVAAGAIYGAVDTGSARR